MADRAGTGCLSIRHRCRLPTGTTLGSLRPRTPDDEPTNTAAADATAAPGNQICRGLRGGAGRTRNRSHAIIEPWMSVGISAPTPTNPNTGTRTSAEARPVPTRRFRGNPPPALGVSLRQVAGRSNAMRLAARSFAILTFSASASLAQGVPVPPGSRPLSVPQAPVGHRQPTPSDLPLTSASRNNLLARQRSPQAMFRSFQARALFGFPAHNARCASQLKPKSISPSRDNGSFPDVFEACEPGRCGIKRSIRVEQC